MNGIKVGDEVVRRQKFQASDGRWLRFGCEERYEVAFISGFHVIIKAYKRKVADPVAFIAEQHYKRDEFNRLFELPPPPFFEEGKTYARTAHYQGQPAEERFEVVTVRPTGAPTVAFGHITCKRPGTSDVEAWVTRLTMDTWGEVGEEW